MLEVSLLNDQDLISAARAARDHAYVPYSHFPVGAALLTENGTLFTGCNVENASYGLACCAERTAIFKAVSEGHRRFTVMAVIGDTAGPCSPCGACRQVMSELGPNAKVILTNLLGETRLTTVQELLPGAFREADLPSRG
jgi:cytidine deaminase